MIYGLTNYCNFIVGKLSTLTSGKIFHYPRFSSDLNGKNVQEELHSFLIKPFVFDAVVRVRASSSLQAGEYFGIHVTNNQTDYTFAALDCEQSFAVTLFHDGKLAESEPVTFQCVILHTTSDGQRRIRVLNLSAPVSGQLPNVFRMAHLDALLQLSVKRAIAQGCPAHPSLRSTNICIFAVPRSWHPIARTVRPTCPLVSWCYQRV